MGHLVSLALIYLSVIYFKERLLTIDSAYYTFKIIYQESFNIEHKRWLALPTQILPLIGLKMGVSLKQFMILYSVSFMLFYYAIFNIITHIFKKPATAIFMLLALVLCARFKYYDAVSEVMTSMAFAALIIAWLQSRSYPFSNKDWIVGILLSLLFALGHPIIYLALIGFLFLLFIDDKKYRNTFFLLFAGLQVIIAFIRIKLFTDGYEAGKMEALGDTSSVLASLEDNYIFYLARDFVHVECYWSYAFFAGAILWLFVKEKYLLAICSFAGFFIFYLMTVIIYHQGESRNMLENYFIIFGFFMALPIFFAFVKNQKFNVIALIFIGFLFKENIQQIDFAHHYFTGRIDYLRHLIDTQEPDKLLYKKEDIIWETLQVPWGTPFETLLLSSLEKDQSKSLFIIDNENSVDSLFLNEDEFLGPEWAPHLFDLEQINKNYFNLSKNNYILIDEPAK